MSDRLTQAMYATWQRIQQDLDVPDIVIALTNDHNSGCSTDFEDRPVIVRINPNEPGPGQLLPLDENGNRLPEDLLLHLLHLGAHAGAPNFPGSGTSQSAGRGSEGRYHGTGFAAAAKELGLETVKRGGPSWSPATGFAIDFAEYADPNSSAFVELSRPKRYKRELDKLEAIRGWIPPEAIRPRQRGPVRMRCACTEETIKAGIRKRLGKTTLTAEDMGLGERGTKTIAAPKVINVSEGVAKRGGLWCQDCKTEFVLHPV
ncbi:MAG: hypothetical protein WBH47_24410 [Streptosporangiaceae bacterium]